MAKKAISSTKQHYQFLASTVTEIIHHSWFVQLDPRPDRVMATLLLAVYSFNADETPLNKKAAWLLLGVEDIKTGRKYIAEAERLGLIVANRSRFDKRKELLEPTERLKELVEGDLRSLDQALKNAGVCLSNPDLETRNITHATSDGHKRLRMTQRQPSNVASRIGRLKKGTRTR